MKGWELYGYNNYYWNYYIEDKLFVDYKCENEHYKTKFTKSEWAELGINDSNADFEEVAE